MYVLITKMKSKDSKKLLLNGLFQIISNPLIFHCQVLLYPEFLPPMQHSQFKKKNSGHQLAMEISNPQLLLILKILKMDPSWNLLNLDMNLPKQLNHLMDKILMLKEISELLLTLGNMDKELIMVKVLLSNSHLNIHWMDKNMKENYKYLILLMMEKNLFYLFSQNLMDLEMKENSLLI